MARPITEASQINFNEAGPRSWRTSLLRAHGQKPEVNMAAFISGDSLEGKRVWGYARRSTVEQKDSLDKQRELVHAYVRSCGGVIDDSRFITDGDEHDCSGATRFADREGGAWLLANLTPGDVLVVWRLDRIGRKLDDVFQWFLTISESMGVEVRILEFNGMTINVSSPIGRMFIAMLAGFAEMHRQFIQASTLESVESRRRRGKPTGKYPPIGYRHIIDKKTGKRIATCPDLEERQVIAEIVQRRNVIARAERDGLPHEEIMDISDDMNRRKIKRKGGADWNHRHITAIWQWWWAETHDKDGNETRLTPWDGEVVTYSCLNGRIEERDI